MYYPSLEDINKLNKYITFRAGTLKNPKLDYDDLVFVGLESILKAQKKFDSTKNVLFLTFSKKIIDNDMFSYIRLINAKNKEENCEEELLSNHLSYNPNSEYDAKILLENKLTSFNDNEKIVLDYLIKGFTIKQIVIETEFNYKKVDNIMQSIKKKIKS